MSDLNATLERLQRAHDAEDCPTCKETLAEDIANVERRLSGGSFLEAGMGGSERRWHVAGPRGAIEAVVSEAPGFGQAVTIAVHDVIPGADPTPHAERCRLTGRACWIEPLTALPDEPIIAAWEATGDDEQLLHGLAELYAELLDREVTDVPDVA